MAAEPARELGWMLVSHVADPIVYVDEKDGEEQGSAAGALMQL